jgi:molybdopterin synthase catalytic subunit
LRERLGRSEESVALPTPSTVADLLDTLASREPFVARARGRFQVAVNRHIVLSSHELAEDDEVALIPPVAGGSDPPATAAPTPPRRIALLATPLVAQELEAAVAGPDRGAIVSFAGVARRHGTLPDVVRLEYEAYVPMAEEVLTAIADEIEQAYPGTRIAIHHRTGTLAIGEAAVLIAAAAPRRAAAFEACRQAIETLKERAPIWKKEIGPGGETWVGFGP